MLTHQFLGHATFRNHVARIYAKIGVNRRIAAVAWARARGFDGEGIAIEAPNQERAA